MGGLAKRAQDVLSGATGSKWFWVAFVAILFAYPLASALTKKAPEPPKVYFGLPEFSLTDQLGRPFGTRDLAGKVWIANFIFTSCPTRCPQLTESMKKLEKRMRNMGSAVYLISFSVDPERDTPERLRAYADKYRANPRRWRFLTGNLENVKAAVVAGFKMPMDPGEQAPVEATPGEPPTIFDITHGTRFVLVDQQGRVRGFYEADDTGMDELVMHLSLIASLESGGA